MYLGDRIRGIQIQSTILTITFMSFIGLCHVYISRKDYKGKPLSEFNGFNGQK